MEPPTHYPSTPIAPRSKKVKVGPVPHLDVLLRELFQLVPMLLSSAPVVGIEVSTLNLGIFVRFIKRTNCYRANMKPPKTQVPNTLSFVIRFVHWDGKLKSQNQIFDEEGKFASKTDTLTENLF